MGRKYGSVTDNC